ncbi:chemotaxis protein CheR [Paraburkholderia strydomiana]|nr:chemotaxis protein CheR [Paraburkholderia strydomiana]
MSDDTANFPIVGIGASAGGVEALDGFFRGVPEAPGLGFVIVTHLSPTRENMLHEIVARYSKVKVNVAADGQRVERNGVYVVSADAVLGIENGCLKIRMEATSLRERKPIDVFFSALAVDQGELSAGVVLSGSDSDGILGIKAIKERGGLTLAQIADGYPPGNTDARDSAIMAALVDLALPADEMGARLAEFARSAIVLDDIAYTFGKGAEAQRLDDAKREICSILRDQVGHDFSGYKSKTFMRRVQRRMHVAQVSTIEAYVLVLQRTPEEAGALFRDLLINVTNFFRDQEAFDKLASEVIPALTKGRGADDTIRVWVPGCATGEEVFSIAILLREHIDGLASVPRVQIFATDIDDRALGVARAARYPEQLLESVQPERRERFFVRDGGSFVVRKDVRDMCVFSPHSVIKDPPFSRMDLVSCRNLLIYFGSDVQNRVIPTFHYALRPGGYLFLGTSENISQFGDLFAPVEKKHRIFRRRSDAGAHIRLPLLVAGVQPGHPTQLAPRRAAMGGAAMRQMVNGHVLDRFSPPHVLVNREGDAVYFSARTGKYLEPASGVPTRQILTMARKDLRLDLRTLFREAVESGRTVTGDPIAVEEEDGRVQMVSLTVEPLSNGPTDEPLFLILFVNQGPVLSREEASNRGQLVHNGTAFQIEQELRETRERLQSIIEEYETALEELKSSNEELVSVNEELQSTNEELEASKEELVSLNEELHTVNAELNLKLDALDHANSDLQNLFDSTAVATVFLDRNLHIRSFTPAITEVFNVLPGDRGRPITDLSSRLQLSGLVDDIQTVFHDNNVIERRVDSEDKTQHFLIRLAPYRDSDRRTAGVVITFMDVTGITRAQARQQVLIAELQHRTRNLLSVIQAIARETLGTGERVEAFVARLAALGRLQALLGRASSNEVDLSEIIELEVGTLGGSQEQKVSISGPPVALRLESVQTVALAIHELATNAVKYGALKHAHGRLRLEWKVRTEHDGKTLVLEWRESGLTEPPDSSRRGYGRQLIEQALAFTLRARTELVFGDDGIVCRIELPLKH